MPKRVRDYEVAAAKAAGDPPSSDDYPDQDEWERQQDDWLERWQPGASLPPAGEKKRRTKWGQLTKKHARHAAAVGMPSKSSTTSFDAEAPGTDASPSDVPADETVDVPEYSRSWELRMLRAMCLGRGVDYNISDTNEELLSKLAGGALPAAPPPPSTAPAERADVPVQTVGIAELRRQCRALGVEYSISDTPAQLKERLSAAGPAA